MANSNLLFGLLLFLLTDSGIFNLPIDGLGDRCSHGAGGLVGTEIQVAGPEIRVLVLSEGRQCLPRLNLGGRLLGHFAVVERCLFFWYPK